MASDPLVSVIIPTYGRAEYLREALRSVREQTYRNIEVLVIDDCSPEPVELGDEGVGATVVRHARNMGPGAARNTGLAHARGDLVAFLDDDDKLVPDRIERGVHEIGDARMHLTPSNIDRRRFEGDMRATLADGELPSILQALTWRRHMLQFDPGLRVSEDIDWWLRMRDQAIFAWSPEPGLWVRRHDAPRPGVDPKVRLRCRQLVVHRHAHTLTPKGRAFQYARTAAGAVLAGAPTETVVYTARALASRPLSLFSTARILWWAARARGHARRRGATA